ncbi:hypothetical protein WR25_27153 [Diploscapter pachys]|uniref:EF-hand domain-containing protein n=1 Tax=Diploscapter pachys TaxID=2018661 RepID=A0A2A2LWE8_9BILA|nr:hypothetical protein WR25_27153 [Diploscapter pachys]
MDDTYSWYSSEVEVDVDDLLSNPFNTQPPSLEQLQKLTGFNRQWLMFVYRNFKQRCPNGRMSETQWRGIFRNLFPNSSDYQFADRLYRAISEMRGHQQITFEDLMICLWELTERGRNSQFVSTSNVSTTAQFVFALMTPDEKDRVDEPSFVEYVRSIFALCSTRPGGYENAMALGLPCGSIYRAKSGEDEMRPIEPLIRRYAIERFKELDRDKDGYISLDDVEREIEANRSSFILKCLNDFADQASTSKIK